MEVEQQLQLLLDVEGNVDCPRELAQKSRRRLARDGRDSELVAAVQRRRSRAKAVKESPQPDAVVFRS